MEIDEDGSSVSLSTGEAMLNIDRADGRMVLCDATGEVLLEEAEPPLSDPEQGFRACFALREGERLYYASRAHLWSFNLAL